MRFSACSLLLLTACDAAGPELFVLVDTDWDLFTDLNGIFAAASADTSQTVEDLEMSEVEVQGPDSLPLSFVVRPEKGAELTIYLRARLLDGGNIDRMARLVAPAEGSFSIPMFLSRSCIDASCGADGTCSEQGCIDAGDLDLRPVTPGRELEGLCHPSAVWCAPDQRSRSSCPIFGGSPLEELCPFGTLCSPASGLCEPDGQGPPPPPPPPRSHMLSVSNTGPGRGAVRSNPGAIDCGPFCFDNVPAGEARQLEAFPAPGSYFMAWHGSCEGQPNPCILNIEGDRNVVVEWDLRPDTTGIPAVPNDLDRDGKGDLLFAAPRLNRGGSPEAGRVYVVFGPAGSPGGDAEFSPVYFDGPAGAYSHFGESIVLSPDLTGDSEPDLVIGAPGMFNDRGAVFIVPGGPQLVRSRGLLPTNAIVITGDVPFNRFGSTVSARGDFDKDGHADLLVGAPGNPSTFGRVFVFFGGPAFGSRDAVSADRVFDSELPGDRFGAALTDLKDVNGDGFDEILIGAPTFGEATSPSGRAYLFFGGPALSSRGAAGADQILSGAVGSQFGTALTEVGDLNRDGRADFAVGSPVLGVVFTFFGGRPERFIEEANADRFLGGTFGFGSSLFGTQDITGDGIWDLVVGSPDDGGQGGGRVSVFSGESIDNQPTFTITSNCRDNGSCVAEGLGVSVGPAGDFDGDGIQDLAVGSNFGGGPAGPPNRGRITVHHFAPGTSSDQWSEDAFFKVIGEPQPGACATVLGSRPW